MSAAAEQVRAPLRWRKPEAHHVMTECGRFSVAKVTVCGVDCYQAFRRTVKDESVFCEEIGVAKVSKRATDAERLEAIRAMKAVCEAAVAAGGANDARAA